MEKAHYYDPLWDYLPNPVKTRLWPYYTNVYYKYTHGYFNINNENLFFKKLILHNINFVKIIIVGPKTKIDTQN